MRLTVTITLAALLGSPIFGAGDSGNSEEKALASIHEIKNEAFANSKVMEHLRFLTDVYGPRLTASPDFNQAADWAMSRLKEYGVANVHEEKWGPFGRSWQLQGYTLEMIAPRFSHLVVVPLAWSGPTDAVKTGEVVLAPFRAGRFYDLKASREAFDKYKAEWKGKLKDKIVLISQARDPEPPTEALFKRYTDAELGDIAKAPQPVMHGRNNVSPDQLKIPEDRDEARKYIASLPSSTTEALYDKYQELQGEEANFFHDEHVVGLLRADDRAHDGLLFAEAAGSHKAKDPQPPPTFVVTQEQYSRMVRLIEQKQTVSVRMGLSAKVSDTDVDGQNIIGEIPGQSKPDEVVMVGAHFDSWHSGTGATDNGAGSAVMIEVIRILKTLNLKMDRTVRIGLWSGEEEGLLGSKAYVKEHFADPKTMQLKSEQAKLDAYLNLDNGSGKIRGVYLEGNDAARPLFTELLQPFRDLGVTTVTLKHTGGTDHLSFDAVGIPGFQFIQDPLDYSTLTHHSDIDTYSHAIPEDMMQASAVIASLVYDIANRPESVPRKPVPPAGE